MIHLAEQVTAPQTRPGHGALNIRCVDGQSAATSVQSASPLKILVPRPRGPSVWAFTSSFGGGLVAGDETRLDLRLDPGTRCFLGTQASTKVYRNPRRQPCGHVTRASIGAGALLVFAPDPVQAFADSSYTQRQEFHLAPDASLVLLDWFTAGRTARGERWQFKHFQSRNAVSLRGSRYGEAQLDRLHGVPSAVASAHEEPDELVFLDSLLLRADNELIASQHRTGRFNCFATLLLIGPVVKPIADTIATEIHRQPVTRNASLLVSASPVRDGILLRLAGEEVEAVGRELHRHLTPLSAPLGDNPWARKW